MMDDTERRVEERSDCEIAAKIELSDRLSIPVVVKDLSATGAKIQVAETVHLPDEFDLLVPAIEAIDLRYRVRIAWRSGEMVGGEFVSHSHVQ